MKKLVLAIVSTAAYSLAFAQIEQHSNTNSSQSSNSRGSSQSYSSTQSIGTLFFPLLAEGAQSSVTPAHPLFNDHMKVCSGLLNGNPYSYSMEPSAYKGIMQTNEQYGGKKSLTRIEEKSTLVNVPANVEAYSINFMSDRIGLSTHPRIVTLCGQMWRGIISFSLSNLSRIKNGLYSVPDEKSLRQAYINGYREYSEKNESPFTADFIKSTFRISEGIPVCTVPTYTSINNGGRDWINCGGSEYHPKPLQFTEFGITILSADTLNGQKIQFTSERTASKQNSSTRTRERTQRANVAQ